MSDTPRTDEAAEEYLPFGEMVPADFARQLEREMNALSKDAERYRWIAADPRNRGSLEWLEADQIDAHIDERMK